MGTSTGERVTKLLTALDTFSHSVEKVEIRYIF